MLGIFIARGWVLAFLPQALQLRATDRARDLEGWWDQIRTPETQGRSSPSGQKSGAVAEVAASPSTSTFPEVRPLRSVWRGAGSQRSQCGFAPSGREPARRHDNRPCGACPGPTPPGVRTRPDPPPQSRRTHPLPAGCGKGPGLLPDVCGARKMAAELSTGQWLRRRQAGSAAGGGSASRVER